MYNCNYDNVSKNTFTIQLTDNLALANDSAFTVQYLLDSLRTQKCGKSPGLDRIHTEALIHACPRLSVHICLLFNLFVKHGHLPKAFMQSVIIPLIKDKSGNLSDINNYRANGVSTAISKLFESMLETSLTSSSSTDKYLMIMLILSMCVLWRFGTVVKSVLCDGRIVYQLALI